MTHDDATVNIIRDLIANDVLVVVTGCAAHAAAKYGYLSPEMMENAGAGPERGLRGDWHPAGGSPGLLRRQ